MHAYLKIKIKSLAAEATMIRKAERRLNPGHRARVTARRIIEGKYQPKEGESIANDGARRSRARRILKRKPSETAMKAFWGLRHHRQYDVRGESRSAHVAYGFLRGRTYKQVEGTAKSSPNWPRVEDLIRKYGEGDIRDRMQRFAEWREAASV